MKVPLEPIPTEQIVIVKQKPPMGELAGTGNHAVGGMLSQGNDGAAPGQLEKAYPWLLGVSTCLSALLCWMYVTKPVIVQETNALPAGVPDSAMVANARAGANNEIVPAAPADEGLVPSDSQLPSGKANPSNAGMVVVSQGATPEAIDPRMLSQKQLESADQGVGAGWEKTNLKVQHILTADTGTGKNEKIVINVPVLYETRSMRWTPDEIEKARDVLARLMLYERSLSNLRKEGEAIASDWNEIIKETVPAGSLRADSPSLPYNHGQESEPMVLPGSSSVIQVEEK